MSSEGYIGPGGDDSELVGPEKAKELAQGVHGFYRVHYAGESGGSNDRLVFDPNQTDIDGDPGWEFTTNEAGEIVLPAGVFMLLCAVSLGAVPQANTFAQVDGDGNTGGGDAYFTSTTPSVGLSYVVALTFTKLLQQDQPGAIYAQLRSSDDPAIPVSAAITLIKLG